MSDGNAGDPLASLIALAFGSDSIAMTGVFAIGRRLIEKGIFDEADVRFVTERLRRAIPVRAGDEANDFVRRNQEDEIADIEKALIEACEKRTINLPR